MNHVKIIYLSFAILLISIISLEADDLSSHVVHIVITSQHYDHYSPWGKRAIRKININGTVINDSLIVTKSSPLSDHLLIEVFRAGSNRRYFAEVVVKDYFSGLALLRVKDKNFNRITRPVLLAEDQPLTGKKIIVAKLDLQGGLKKYTAEANFSSMNKSSDRVINGDYSILNHQMTTGMDSGGNGEPVFLNGRLLGIVTGFNERSKIISVCDAMNIRRMLNDMSDGKYHGTPFFKIGFAPLKSDINLRNYIGIEDDDTGVFVNSVHPFSSGNSILEKGDIILKINDRKIDDNGMFKSKYHGRLDFRGLIYSRKQVGHKIKMQIFRKKKKINVEFELKSVPVNKFKVPGISFDSPLKYYIYGGLIFQELTDGFLKLWGSNWKSKANKRLLYNYYRALDNNTEVNRKIIILNRVLPASVNSGYQGKSNLILKKLNGVEIDNLDHLKSEISKMKSKFVKIDFIGGSSIVLERKLAKLSESGILRNYNIKSSSYP